MFIAQNIRMSWNSFQGEKTVILKEIQFEMSVKLLNVQLKLNTLNGRHQIVKNS